MAHFIGAVTGTIIGLMVRGLIFTGWVYLAILTLRFMGVNI